MLDWTVFHWKPSLQSLKHEIGNIGAESWFQVNMYKHCIWALWVKIRTEDITAGQFQASTAQYQQFSPVLPSTSQLSGHLGLLVHPLSCPPSNRTITPTTCASTPMYPSCILVYQCTNLPQRYFVFPKCPNISSTGSPSCIMKSSTNTMLLNLCHKSFSSQLLDSRCNF